MGAYQLQNRIWFVQLKSSHTFFCLGILYIGLIIYIDSRDNTYALLVPIAIYVKDPSIPIAIYVKDI